MQVANFQEKQISIKNCAKLLPFEVSIYLYLDEAQEKRDGVRLNKKIVLACSKHTLISITFHPSASLKRSRQEIILAQELNCALLKNKRGNLVLL